MSTPAHLGIVDVAQVCAGIAARSLDLFETTGGWVADTPDPEQQRTFAEGSHRHAWHATLWSARSPTIPIVDHDGLVSDLRESIAPVAQSARVDCYRDWLDDLLDRLDHVEARTHPEFDPGTMRAVTLTRADLADLRWRLAPK